MSQRNIPTNPFLEDIDCRVLGGIINRIAETFDVTALSSKELLVLYTLLERAINALWNAHQRELLQFYTQAMADTDSDDEPDDNDPDDDTDA